MPAFPERESSILAVLKKKKPGRVPENEIRPAHNVHNHQPDSTTPHVSYLSLYLMLYTILKITVNKMYTTFHFTLCE